jgi:hypothetical protein
VEDEDRKGPEKLSAPFALVVEIDAGTTEADLYTEVEMAIKNLSVVTTAT